VALIVIVNGPNLNLLGSREPGIYGTSSWDKVKGRLQALADEKGIEIEYFQSNHEGSIIDFIQEAGSRARGMIINPGALTHYSYALRDTIATLAIPVIEVHISNIYAREDWRSRSVVSPVVRGTITGFGVLVYEMAVMAMINIIGEKE